jgi:tRNA 2-thiocytidine biosynthesis protein TtcA
MSTIQGPEFYISRKVGKAIGDYGLITDGDKIAVAVSGGKDSLTMLRVLNDRKRFVPVKYELIAVHIDMGYPCQHPKILAEYFQQQNINYHIEKIDILKGKSRKEISCFWCAWNRRKALFQTAERFGCAKVALGHHFDDIVETMLLNLFFQGEISAMAPKQPLFDGKITIIRPLAYVEERQIVRFAKGAGFPQHKCACPNSLTSKRQMVTEMLRELEKSCPDVKKNIFRSVKRIKKDYLP